MEKRTFDVKHTIAVEVSEEMIHDNLVSAIEGGSHYWAKIDAGEHKPGWANYFTASFVKLDTRGGHKFTLSTAKLVTGLHVLASKYPHHFGDILCQRGDATTGDVLVQCALFGEIIYG